MSYVYVQMCIQMSIYNVRHPITNKNQEYYRL